MCGAFQANAQRWHALMEPKGHLDQLIHQERVGRISGVASHKVMASKTEHLDTSWSYAVELCFA